ncbi:MAG: DUF3137 domain-containing protein [Candidatus Heimdallarchaeota archaeon]|nr:DUF3137 domain-containing protein [Candidatus Heimdallarchaeota archaeon]
MKSLDELRKYYDTELMSELIELEQQRKDVIRKLIKRMGIVLAIAIMAIGSIIAFADSNSDNSPLLIIAAIAAFLVGGIVFQRTKRLYTSRFKDQIIAKLVKFIHEGLSYQKDSCISSSIYNSSQIFKQRVDRYRGDDYVSGKIDKTFLQFSELHTEYKTEHCDSKGNRQIQWHTIFKGLFFIADFNKHFKGTTLVLPDVAEKLFGQLGNFLQSKNMTRGQLVKMEDPEFEKLFVVYSSDQIEARYILSPGLMRRIVDFKQKNKKQIYLSFVSSRVFVAISYLKSLFEPRIFRTVIDFKPIQEYFEDLQLAIGIVDDLNLNLRIWTKE